MVDNFSHLGELFPAIDDDWQKLMVVWHPVDVGAPMTDCPAKLVKVALLCKLFELTDLLFGIAFVLKEVHTVLDHQPGLQNLLYNGSTFVHVLHCENAISLLSPVIKRSAQFSRHHMSDDRHLAHIYRLHIVASCPKVRHILRQLADVDLL